MNSELPETIETAGTFGNYLIHGIDEIILPNSISLWPTAPGWQVLGAITLILLAAQLSKVARRWWRNRYRREVLHQLDSTHRESQLATLPYYLKVTALNAYSRQDVAGLSGEKWLAFLDANYNGPPFSTGVGRKLLSIAYLPSEQWLLTDEEGDALIRISRQWIAKHKEAANA